jgi:uncharacterized protein (DUF302 family)
MRALETTVDLPLEEAEAVMRDALAEQGFGVLTEIDVAATLKTKLGIDRQPLRILGACNPTLAHQALEFDQSVSLVLPCNVVIEPAGTGTRIAIADPRELMPDPAFHPGVEVAHPPAGGGGGGPCGSSYRARGDHHRDPD